MVLDMDDASIGMQKRSHGHAWALDVSQESRVSKLGPQQNNKLKCELKTDPA